MTGLPGTAHPTASALSSFEASNKKKGRSGGLFFYYSVISLTEKDAEPVARIRAKP